MPRRRKEIPAPIPSETIVLAIEQLFEKILISEESEFPLISSFTAQERAYIHQKARALGLKSKSKGKNEKRFLTIYKLEGSTIIQKDAILRITNQSKQLLERLASKYPLSHREKQDLLPPTERDRNQSMDLIRDMRLGKNVYSSPMVLPDAGKTTPEMDRWRKNLPIYKKREDILQAINANPVCIIQGETGCGKTTQIPQYILENCREQRQCCKIIVTEPRRLACISVCERVCNERNEPVGHIVGYQIRLESKLSNETIVTFCTPGIMISAMLNETSMSNVTHIIVDEIHERDRFCDFLLICLRDFRVRFPHLRIILMSATINTQIFEKYFGCPVVTIPGRTYSVREAYLLDVLKMTGYSTPKMVEIQKMLKEEKEYCEDAKSDAPSAAASTSTREFVLEDSAISELDNCIERAFNCGDDDSLMQLLHLLLSEGYPIDFRHTTTGLSALMVAAARNQVQMVETLLKYGADPEILTKNKQNALDIARAAEATDAVAYLETVQALVPTVEEKPLPKEDQLLLDSYLQSADDQKVNVDLIVKLIFCLMKSKGNGAILVFLPGCEDIIKVRDRFRADDSALPDRLKYRLYLLHSQFRNDSKAVFKPAPDRARKIILATNIAETSITIDDVVYVIDTGKVKQKSLDILNGASQLDVDWISKACAEQRKGRAGRCQEGFCYRLYSKQRYNSFDKYTLPEILRTHLSDFCLQAKLFAQNNCTIAEFLGKAIEPPTQRVIRDAVQLLKTIDALNAWEDLTPLGICLLNLSTDPRYGKMLLYAVILKCLDPILTIVATMDAKDPFIIPTNPVDRAKARLIRKNLAAGSFSDHFVLLRIYQGWQQAVANRTDHHFCEEHYVSPHVLEMIQGTRTQLLGQLRGLGLVRKHPGDMRDLNSNSDSWAVVKAAICAGLYPNIARVDREQNVIRTRKECKVSFHQGSVLRSEGDAKFGAGSVKHLVTDWVLYTDLVKVGPFCHFRTCTLVTPVVIALVCCPAQSASESLHDDGFRTELADPVSDSEVEDEAPTTRVSLTVDEWIDIRGNDTEIDKLTYARNKLQAICLRRLMACASPNKAAPPTHQADDTVIKNIVSVLVAEDKAMGLIQPLNVGQRPKNVDGVPNEALQTNPAQSSTQRNRNWQQHYPRDGDRTESHGLSRYFIVRSPSVKALEQAFVRSTWLFTKSTEKKLREAREEGAELIIIFAACQMFHGVAKLGMAPQQMGVKWPLRWIKKHAVPIDAAHTIPLPEDLRTKPLNRDGLELPEYVARAVMRLWERSLMGPRPYNDNFSGRGLNQFGFVRNM